MPESACAAADAAAQAPQKVDSPRQRCGQNRQKAATCCTQGQEACRSGVWWPHGTPTIVGTCFFVEVSRERREPDANAAEGPMAGSRPGWLFTTSTERRRRDHGVACFGCPSGDSKVAGCYAGPGRLPCCSASSGLSSPAGENPCRHRPSPLPHQHTRLSHRIKACVSRYVRLRSSLFKPLTPGQRHPPATATG